MNQEIRAAIISLLSLQSSVMEDNIQSLIQTYGVGGNIMQTVYLMKDAGELVSEGRFGALRLSLKLVEAQAPLPVRMRRYMGTNWIAILGAVAGIIGAITSIIAIVISIMALHR